MRHFEENIELSYGQKCVKMSKCVKIVKIHLDDL